ncbi:MAG: choice-of-anchor L domain-containing protein [Bacteroidales bacterium]|nr:choice-of-anchor L domain-containing protein [Bacteroidales bacterium]
MKTIIALLSCLIFANFVLAQTSLSSNIDDPTQVFVLNGKFSETFDYNLTANYDLVKPFCSRNYQHKELYFTINLSELNEIKLKVSHNQVTDHGVELYTLNNGVKEIISCVQTIDSTSEFAIPKEEILSNIVFGRIWINEIENQGMLKIAIEENSSKALRTSATAINIATGNPEELVQNVLISGCVEASNINYTGHTESLGFFSSGTPGLDFDSGIILSSGSVLKAKGPNNSPATCTNLQTPGDSLLSSIINRASFDAAILEFDFVPASNTISFQYVFGSEEYEEYVGNVFNDIFAFHISGGPENYNNKNIALIPGTNIPVSINNVNHLQNTNYYQNNDDGEHLQYDGLTTTLTAFAEVTPCQTYHIRLSIADAADPIFDSGVFLKAGSFSSGTIPLVKNYTEDWVIANATYEGCLNQLVFARSDNNNINQDFQFDIEISGTAQAGIDYSELPTSIVIPAGQEFISIPYSVYDDGIFEGTETLIIKIYTNCGCGTEFIEKIIYINEPIEITGNLSSSEPVCENDTVHFKLEVDEFPENYSIVWSTGQTDTTEIDVIANESGNIYATVFYPCNEKIFSTYLKVKPAPEANIFTSSPGCSGDDISFSAENGISYLWKGPEAFFTTESSFTLENAQPNQSGIYGVTVTGDNGCQHIETLNIQINDYPVIQLPNSMVLCERDSLIINPGDFFQYSWSGPQNWMSNSDEINIANTTISYAGTYYLTVADEVGCESYAQTEVVINPAPVAAVSYEQFICHGNNSTLIGSGNGNPQWQTPNELLNNQSIVNIENANIQDSGIYVFSLENEFNCKDSIQVEINVVIPDAEILTEGAFCTNTGTLNLESAYPFGTWDAPALIDTIAGTIDLTNLTSGIYDISYSIDFDGCSDMQISQIAIQAANPVEIMEIGQICSNIVEITLEASPPEGVWSGDIVLDPNRGIINPMLTTDAQTTITYEYIEGVCVNTDSITIEISQIPIADINEISNVCITEHPILLTVNSAGGIWSGNGIINSFTGKFSPSTAGGGMHSIYYQITNQNCSSIDSIIIIVDTVISAQIGSDLSFCNNTEDIVLSSLNNGGVWSGYGIANPTGVFSPSSVEIGSDYVYHETINGECYAKDSILVSVHASIPADFDLPDQICLYDNNLQIISENIGGIWYGEGITDSLSSVFNPLIAGVGIHEIQYQTNNNACLDLQTHSIEVLDAPDPNFTCDAVLCSGDYDITLNPVTCGGIWYVNGIENNEAGIFNPSFGNLGANYVKHTVSNYNCTSSYTKTLWVIDGTEDIVNNNPDSICINIPELRLNAYPSGGFWTGVGVINDTTFSPEIAGAGSHTLLYHLGTGSCEIIKPFNIFVDEIADPSLLTNNEFCNNSLPIDLITDIPGGVWSGTSVINNQFYPQIADTGLNIVNYQYHSGVCTSNSQFELYNHAAAPLSITLLDSSYCQNAAQVYPVFSPAGGVISGIQVFDDNSFRPIDLPIGQNTITYTYTNTNGCVSEVSKNFEILEIPDVIISGIDSIYCQNSSDVAFHVYPYGGTFDGVEIFENWFSPSLTTVGEHILTYLYTAPNGCSSSYSQTLTITNSPEIFFEIIQTPICYNDSSAIVRVSSENNDIETVLWSDYNNTTTETLTNIPSGWHYVTVTSTNNCIITDSVYIPQNAPLVIDISGTNSLLCSNSNTGIINVNVSGGLLPYEFIWEDNSSINSPDRDSLPAGVYNVTVIDNNGCQVALSHTIEQANPLVYEINIINHNLCFNDSSGAVEIKYYDDYEILWSDNNSNPIRDNLNAGWYIFTITNVQNCQIIDSVEIYQPEPIEIVYITDTVVCGVNLGNIITTTSGGLPPYSYVWSNGVESSAIYDLAAGEYTISITDANNCLVSQNIFLSATNDITAEIEIVQPIMCFDDETGIITAQTPDGFTPVSFLWNTYQTKDTLIGLAAGQYDVTITDNYGCTGIAQTNLTEPDEMQIDKTITNLVCYGDNNGSIALNVSGGTGNLFCTWDNQTEGFINNNLNAGTYNYSITDENACEEIGSVTIIEPENRLKFELLVNEPLCFGENSGSLILDAHGGTAPYNYVWQINEYQIETKNINNLYSGNYSYTITDANNCSISDSVTLSNPEIIETTYTSTQASCKGKNDGEILLSVSGGTAPYRYVYDNNTYYNNEFTNMPPGNYMFTIIDNNNCTAYSLNAIIEESDIDCLEIPNAFTPNGDGINDRWEIENIDMFPNARVQIFNRWGQVVFETRSNEQLWDGTSSMGDCPTGTYVFIVELFNGTEPHSGYISLVR